MKRICVALIVLLALACVGAMAEPAAEAPAGLTVTVTGQAGVRKVTGGYLINGDIATAGTVTASYLAGTNVLTVRITAAEAFSETNNTPLSVASATNNGIKITFS